MDETLQQSLNQYVYQDGAALNVHMTLGSNEAIKQTVAGGMGLSILSRHVLGHAPRREGLKELAVEHFALERAWYGLYRRARALSLVARTFLDYLLEPAPCSSPPKTRPAPSRMRRTAG